MTPEPSPRVSVIIPAYNHARFLSEALESVRAQTFQAFEALVVDDGSTDETREVVAAYAPRVGYHYQAHAGVSRARNEGLRRTGAPYVAFLDADDTWAPTKLARQVAFLDTHPEVGVVFTSYHVTNEAGRPCGVEPGRFPYGERPFETMLLWPYGSMNVAMVRRSCIARVGGFDEVLTEGEDWDLWLRVSRYYGIANLDEPLATYRRVASDATRARRLTTAPAMFRRVLDKLFTDPARLEGCSAAWIRRWRRRAYASLEITVALMEQDPPWRCLSAALRLSPFVVCRRWRAMGFLILSGLKRLAPEPRAVQGKRQ